MSLPMGTYLIEGEYIDPDGLYQIGPGNTFIFKFRVEPFGKTTINLSHKLNNTQDMTLNAWFSKKPLVEPLFSGNPALNNFKLVRRRQTFEFWDELVYAGDDTKILLDAGRDYYINIKNLQNSNNGFKLTFGDDCGCDND